MTPTKEQVCSLIPFPLRERHIHSYGPLYGSLLNLLLGLVVCQERERLSDYEIQSFAESLFESYIAEFVPKIGERAARYQSAQQAEQHRLQVQMSEQAHRREERLRLEEEAREKAAAEAEAARYKKARDEEAATREELSRIRAQEQRELQEKML